jgi:amidase
LATEQHDCSVVIDVDLGTRPAVELVAMLARDEVGIAELRDHYLARMDRWNPTVNAVVTVDAEAQGGGPPLFGLPVTFKDHFNTAGMRTTAGTVERIHNVPDDDAVAVARLRRAGATVLGKTNMPPLASGFETSNSVFGTTRNPWDTARSCGVSSGGSAAAVAAGLTGLDLGSDIGGSVRVPAHFCGVYALKPSFGLVPRQGVVPGGLADRDMWVPGPIGRSADDLELALAALAGPADDRARAWRLALPPPRHRALDDYRIAAWIDERVDDDVAEVLGSAADALTLAGAHVDRTARPPVDLDENQRLFETLLLAATSPGRPGDEFSHREWLAVNEQREALRRIWSTFFDEWDVLLVPPCPVVAHPLLDSGPYPPSVVISGVDVAVGMTTLFVWSGLASVAYLPSVVAPVGRTRSGLPVGVEIVGPFLEDRSCIDVARRITKIVGGFVPPPGFG